MSSHTYLPAVAATLVAALGAAVMLSGNLNVPVVTRNTPGRTTGLLP